MATTQVIFDLASRREYIKPLRDEIQQVIDEDGQDTDGEGFLKLKKASLTKLKKLDSFLKESQRMSPPGVSTFPFLFFQNPTNSSQVSNTRITTAPLSLSTGHTLPTNTRIAFPSQAVHLSPETLTFSATYNPSTNAPPSQFDGFRFYNLRLQPGKENRHQFVSTSADSLVFGHGNHACPGRFFASNEIKVVIIELLRNWEFRIKGDTLGEGGVERRPRNHENELGITPNMAAQVEFKRRKE